MSEFPVNVTTFSRKYVVDNHKVLFNVSNLYKDKHRPEDYVSVCQMCSTGLFIEQFHPETHYILELTPEDIEWMKRAQLVFAQTGRFSPIFAGDLQRSCERHKAFMDRILAISDKWFIRSEDFSLKESSFGIGPHNSLERILPAVLACESGHSCFRQTDKTKTLYFMPWIEIDVLKEFRVFVFGGRVTAISQQFLGEVDPWLASKSKDELSEICRKICDAHQNDFREKLQYLGDRYVMDIVLIGDDEVPYFIEPNPFGAEYSSGSSLFHWITDADVLEGRSEFELRFVDRP
jgi:hypothetical protein